MFLSKIGKYYYFFYQNPISGKRAKISTKSTKKSEAYKFLQNFKEIARPKIKLVTLNEFRDEILKYATFHYAKGTVNIYTRVLDLLNIFLGNVLIKFISQNQIEKYKAYRIGSGVSKTTVNIEFKTMKSMFNIAKSWGLIEINSCIGVKQYAMPQKEILAFTEQEIERIKASLVEDYLKDLIIFALNTGCRLNEITHCQWRDIDIEDRLLHIRNKPNFKTKTGKMRIIPMSDNLIKMIERLFIKDPEVKPEEYLFHKKPGIPFNGNFISKKFKDCLRTMKFPNRYHFHYLRHTFITQLVRKGVNIYDIKQLAGHSEISTTELYMHNITDDLRKAVNLIYINV